MTDPTLNKKKWWAIVKRIYGNNRPSSIPTIIENHVSITDPVHKARIFNDYFIAQTELVGSANSPPYIEPFQTSRYLSEFGYYSQPCRSFRFNEKC